MEAVGVVDVFAAGLSEHGDLERIDSFQRVDRRLNTVSLFQLIHLGIMILVKVIAHAVGLLSAFFCRNLWNTTKECRSLPARNTSNATL